MGRKQQSGFGVVARTGVSLLALGFGSALFGAMVVGPRLGGLLNRDGVSAESRPPAAETRLASANLNADDDQSLRQAEAVAPTPSEPEPEVAEPATAPEEETENPDLIQYAEGTGPSPGVTPEDVVETPEPAATVEPEPSLPIEPRTVKAEPVSRRAAEPKVERLSEPEKPTVRERKPEVARSKREPEAKQAEPEKRKPERAATRPKSEPETRVTERAPRTASAKVETDKRTPERVESNKPFAPREAAAPEALTPEGKLFRVRVGRVTSREDAEKLRDDLRDNVGIDAFLVKSGDGFRVQTGAYRARANAEKIAAELRAGSFRPEVTED